MERGRNIKLLWIQIVGSRNITQTVRSKRRANLTVEYNLRKLKFQNMLERGRRDAVWKKKKKKEVHKTESILPWGLFLLLLRRHRLRELKTLILPHLSLCRSLSLSPSLYADQIQSPELLTAAAESVLIPFSRSVVGGYRSGFSPRVTLSWSVSIF